MWVFHFILQSHVCAVVRIGSVFFSIGYLVYLFLELITVAEEEAGSPCYNPLRATVCCLNMTFVVLQSFLIFYYPRLNLSISPVIDRFVHVMSMLRCPIVSMSFSDLVPCTSWQLTFHCGYTLSSKRAFWRLVTLRMDMRQG